MLGTFFALGLHFLSESNRTYFGERLAPYDGEFEMNRRPPSRAFDRDRVKLANTEFEC